MKPIKNSNKLSTENLKWNYSYIKDLSLAIKSDPTSKIYKIERGFFYLKRKKYLRAIDDFSTVAVLDLPARANIRLEGDATTTGGDQ